METAVVLVRINLATNAFVLHGVYLLADFPRANIPLELARIDARFELDRALLHFHDRPLFDLHN